VDSSYLGVLLPAFVVLAAGMAATMTPMTAAVMGSVETRHAGVASAATNTSRELGGVLGIAVLGAVFTSAFNRGFVARLVDSGVPSTQANAILHRAGAAAAAGSTNAAGAVDPVVGHAIQSSFVHAIHVGTWVAIGVMVVASIISAVFVRSHVGNHDGETVAHAG
jgi:DHA2 family multidrug resistance protein-like MFS transporter